MSEPERQRLKLFSGAIRESTLIRLRVVPAGQGNWRPTPEAMSFADLAQHLVDADRWLFRKLKQKDLKAITGRPRSVEITNRTQFQNILDQLQATGRQRAELLERLTDEEFSELIYDERFGGEVSVWWIIMRGNLDHEIHHRGQIAAYLRIIRAAPE